MVGRPGTRDVDLLACGRRAARRAPRPSASESSALPHSDPRPLRSTSWISSTLATSTSSTRRARSGRQRGDRRVRASTSGRRRSCRGRCATSGSPSGTGVVAAEQRRPRRRAPASPPPRSITATGTRSVTAMCTVCGQPRDDLDAPHRGDRLAPGRAIASRSTRASGVPVGDLGGPLDRVRPRPSWCPVTSTSSAVDVAGEEHQPHRARRPRHEQQREQRPAHRRQRPASRRLRKSLRAIRTVSSSGPADGGGASWLVGDCGRAGGTRQLDGVGHASPSRAPRSLEQLEHLGAEQGHVAGAEGEHDVAGPGALDEMAAVRPTTTARRPRAPGSGTASATSAPVTPGSGSSRAT